MNTKNKIILTSAIIIIIAGLAIIIWRLNENKIAVNNNPNNAIQNLQPEIGDVLGDIYPILIRPAVNNKFDAIRCSCQNKKIVSKTEEGVPFGSFSWANSIKIIPGDIELKKIDPTSKFISYTFDKDCKNIYAIVNYDNNNRTDIFKFNAEDGKYEELIENLLPHYSSTEEMMAAVAPSPMFIYAINKNKLLISFFKFTTGLDAFTNFTIHKIFDLTSNKFSREITFTDDPSGEWLLPPTILNFKTNILSNAIGTSKQLTGSYKNLIRNDFDLIYEKFLSSKNLDSDFLKSDELLPKLFFTCPSKENELEEYNKCIKENIENIFPKLKKKLSNPAMSHNKNCNAKII